MQALDFVPYQQTMIQIQSMPYQQTVIQIQSFKYSQVYDVTKTKLGIE